jgi:hypothetical protein
MQLKSRLARLMLSTDGRVQELARVMGQLDPLAREVELLSHFTTPNRLYAYCFCGAP